MVEKNSANNSETEEERVQKIYGSNENPLAYMIEPKSSIKITDKIDNNLKIKDFDTIL